VPRQQRVEQGQRLLRAELLRWHMLPASASGGQGGRYLRPMLQRRLLPLPSTVLHSPLQTASQAPSAAPANLRQDHRL